MNVKYLIQVIFISLFVLSFLLSCSRQPVYPEPPRIGSEVVIDVKMLKPETPEFFTYHYRNKKINFFVVKINEKVLSFFDTCTVCYPKKRGYSFDSGYIFCRSCNVRYPVSEIEKGIGGCYPIQIGGHIKDEKYFIPVSLLEKVAQRF